MNATKGAVSFPVAFLACLLAWNVATAQIPLPAGGEVEGWFRSGRPQTFTNETLYNYIDGGADVFLEYGFKELFVQEYRKGENILTIEVYRMSSPLSAFGIYSFRRDRRFRKVNLGNEGTDFDYSLIFWQGDHFVVIQSLSFGLEVKEDMRSFGEVISKKLGDVWGGKIGLLDYLPKEHRLKRSETLVLGPLALSNHFPGPAKVFFQQKPQWGVVADYLWSGQRLKFLLLEYKKAKQASEAFSTLTAHLKETLLNKEGSRAFLKTSKDNVWLMGQEGRFLVAIHSARDREPLENLWEAARSHLREQIQMEQK